MRVQYVSKFYKYLAKVSLVYIHNIAYFAVGTLS